MAATQADPTDAPEGLDRLSQAIDGLRTHVDRVGWKPSVQLTVSLTLTGVFIAGLALVVVELFGINRELGALSANVQAIRDGQGDLETRLGSIEQLLARGFDCESYGARGSGDRFRCKPIQNGRRAQH